jgi:sulfonate transport system substrate-binding protein
MKKIIICLSVIVIGLFLVPGPSPVDAAAKADKISITYVKLPLNVPAILAKRLGLFEKEFGPDGITIQRPELTAGPQQTEALAAGSVQFASVLSSDSAILAKANGVDLKVIATFSRAPKAFNVMAKNPVIRKVTDLKGKTVAGPKGSLLNHLLFAALKKEGLTPADVKYVNMAGAQAQAALVSGSIDAALIAGPALVAAEAAGARVIANGDGLIGGLLVVAVSGPFLRDYPDLAKRYLKVHDQALQYLKNNPAESIKIVAEETQISEADVKRMLPWYDFSPKITDADLADLAATQTFLKENDMLITTINIKDLIAIIR